jgi:hypothetical protein
MFFMARSLEQETVDVSVPLDEKCQHFDHFVKKSPEKVAQPNFSRLNFRPLIKKFRPNGKIFPNLVTLTFVESVNNFIQSLLF